MEQAWYQPGQIVVEICGCMRHSNGRQIKRCPKHAAEDAPVADAYYAIDSLWPGSLNETEITMKHVHAELRIPAELLAQYQGDVFRAMREQLDRDLGRMFGGG